MKTFIISCICGIISIGAWGQEKVHQTFKDTRVINSHSLETLRKGILDFRVSHRFGDVAGNAGGWPTFYGLENASDILIGFEYGITEQFMVGVSRSKGSGPLRSNVNGLLKYRLIQQEINGRNPFSVTFVSVASASTMQKSGSEGVLNFFAKTAHRFSYNLQMIIGSKISEKIALQVMGAWTYRNIVPSTDKNDLASVGFSAKFQLSKVFGLIVDTNFPISELRSSENGYYPPIGIGFEWETGGGHVFQINLTNATGIMETDYLPYTQSNWGDGEYRLGFTISRHFRI